MQDNFVCPADVFICNLGENSGSVQSGCRPCIVVSNAKCCMYSSTIQVVPMTSKPKPDLPTHYLIYNKDYNKLQANVNTVLAEQITTIDKAQLIEKICTLSPKDLYHVINCVKRVFPC